MTAFSLDSFSLSGKVVLVTGASSGLGAGFARALSTAGADVVLAARREDRIAELAAGLSTGGRRAIAVRCDVASPQDCTAAVERATSELGAVHVLVNNAGVGTAVPALRETPEQFRGVIEVNLNGAYWMAQACARVMAPGSSIVNIASVLAFMPSFAPQAAYAASKAGMLGLTRDLAAQWSRRRGIRVNAIAPGYYASDMTDEIPRETLTTFIDQNCLLGRLGEQHELDAAVVFLASDASSYVTGTTLSVDGGMTCR